MTELPNSAVITALVDNGWHIVFTDRVRRDGELRRRHLAYLEHADTGAALTIELGHRGQQRGTATYFHVPTVSALLHTETATTTVAHLIPSTPAAVTAIPGATITDD